MSYPLGFRRPATSPGSRLNISLLPTDEGLTLETSALVTLYNGQFTLSTQLIKAVSHNTLHQRNTTVSLETYPLSHYLQFWR